MSRYDDYQKQLFDFNIKSQDKVLDIGSGHQPFRLATQLADINVKGCAVKFGRGSPFKTISGKQITECSVESMPFKDKEFDFVYCSHVLEHTIDPAAACSELIRIGKRGYIETPTRMKDLIFNTIKTSHHRWAVENIKGKLIFTRYTEEDIKNSFTDILREMVCSPQTDREKALSSTFRCSRSMVLNTMLLWENSFEYSILA